MIKISKPLTQATSMLGATWVIPQIANTNKGAAIDFLPGDLLNLIKLCSLPHYSFQPSWDAPISWQKEILVHPSGRYSGPTRVINTGEALRIQIKK